VSIVIDNSLQSIAKYDPSYGNYIRTDFANPGKLLFKIYIPFYLIYLIIQQLLLGFSDLNVNIA